MKYSGGRVVLQFFENAFVGRVDRHTDILSRNRGRVVHANVPDPPTGPGRGSRSASDRLSYVQRVEASPALCFAHRAFCAAEILARASADMVRFFLPAVAADPRILLTTNAVWFWDPGGRPRRPR